MDKETQRQTLVSIFHEFCKLNISVNDAERASGIKQALVNICQVLGEKKEELQVPANNDTNSNGC